MDSLLCRAVFCRMTVSLYPQHMGDDPVALWGWSRCQPYVEVSSISQMLWSRQSISGWFSKHVNHSPPTFHKHWPWDDKCWWCWCDATAQMLLFWSYKDIYLIAELKKKLLNNFLRLKYLNTHSSGLRSHTEHLEKWPRFDWTVL